MPAMSSGSSFCDTYGRLSCCETLFIAEEAQTRSERETDLAGELIAQLGEETLSCLVLRVGVDAKHGDGALDRDLLRLLHQCPGRSNATKCRIDCESMYDYGRFINVPAHLGVVGLLIHGHGSNSRDVGVYFGYPELSEVDV